MSGRFLVEASGYNDEFEVAYHIQPRVHPHSETSLSKAKSVSVQLTNDPGRTVKGLTRGVE